jgi:hypothetical protein
MAEIPENELDETRAALAPTLDAIAAILPWLTKPRPPRFDAELNKRWIAACDNLTNAWLARFTAGMEPTRPAIFVLYSIALETADADCLRLGEALASAADRLEANPASPHLIAALTACIESLHDREGLENPVFAERAGHFAQRLESVAAAGATGNQRSIAIDRLFVCEANEQLEQMNDAFAQLLPDPLAIKLLARQLARAAETIELFEINQLARQFAESIDTRITNLDDELTREKIQKDLKQLARAIAAVNG